MPSLCGYATRWTFASNPGSTRREHATVTDLLDKVYYIELTLYLVLLDTNVAILRMTSLPVYKDLFKHIILIFYWVLKLYCWYAIICVRFGGII